MVYEKTSYYKISSYPTLENALFEAVKFKKNVDFDKWKYFGYRTGFDRHEDFHILIGEIKNM